MVHAHLRKKFWRILKEIGIKMTSKVYKTGTWLFKMSPCANEISKCVSVQIFFQNDFFQQDS